MAELAAEIGASKRTVQRYMDAMRDRFGAEVEFDFAREGYRYANDGLEVPPARLKDEELLAIFVAEPILAQYRGTPLEQDFADAFRHLTIALPQKVRERLAPISSRISVHAPAPIHADGKIFRVLLNATTASKQLKITYSPKYRLGVGERVVDPYALRCVDATWYLLAYCHERKMVLSFAAHRIWSASQSNKSFRVPESFDANDYLRNALGIFRAPFDADDKAKPFEAVIRFDALAAGYVRERQWHPSQKLTDLSGGGLELRVTLVSSVELERFVLAWAEHAQVIAPPELRNRLEGRLRAALKAYDTA